MAGPRDSDEIMILLLPPRSLALVPRGWLLLRQLLPSGCGNGCSSSFQIQMWRRVRVFVPALPAKGLLGSLKILLEKETPPHSLPIEKREQTSFGLFSPFLMKV